MQKTLAAHLIPSIIGTPFEGGFFAGLYLQDGQKRALIYAGKAGIQRGTIGTYRQDVAGASSYMNSLANTIALSAAGSEMAGQALALRIGGFDGWGIATRDQAEMLYRHFKPTNNQNTLSFRDGDNPSSLPAGYPYTEGNPAQTTINGFREGEEHAIPADWIVTSTQYSPSYMWAQSFSDGYTYCHYKDNKANDVAVRSIVVTD